MKLAKYSFGTGDRFGLQGSAQLEAITMAKAAGVELAIVWNKSQREHGIVGTVPADVRREADAAVRAAGDDIPYHVDADHINLTNVDAFIEPSDFFTIDVADFIGKKAADADLADFVARFSRYNGRLLIEGIAEPLSVTSERLAAIAEKYLFAVQQAASIYRHIETKKGPGLFITEVSMDETAEPQTPDELFFILAAIALHHIPVQTIAPKFTGRFNKGVDYQGDVSRFNQEFSDDVCVIRRAVTDFGLPADLKLSVHSGSDKFSIYPGIRRAITSHNAGVHIKTAGTTWLEELIGLAEAGGEAAEMVKKIYAAGYGRFEELCQPYATVIDINRGALPKPETVAAWPPNRLARAIRHDQSCPDYDRNLRQLLHVGYKVAAELGEVYLVALQTHREMVGKHVRDNLFLRHIKPLFL
ncbi:MAG: tagaturonate epimerase family protein [Proteobacteria bacterium]|nr:tagaturonate epimerase family protein [Pseudomonadota bacterium]